MSNIYLCNSCLTNRQIIGELNEIVETLPLNKRGDRITLGSEWWRIWETTDNGHHFWERVLVMELRYQRDTVEVLCNGHRSVVEIDQLFKEKPKPEVKPSRQEEEIQKLQEEVSRLRKEMKTKVGYLRKQLVELQEHSAFKNIS
jgi:hypothetical protein